MLGDVVANIRTACGHRGEIRAGYQLAASFTNWTLTPNSQTGKHGIVGVVSAASEHWLSYEPLSLILEVGYGNWIWDDARPIIAGNQVTVVVTGRPKLERS